MAVSLILGFISGIPLALTAATLQAWMVDEKISLTTIGLFSLVGLPYTLKFLWAPLMDRYVPPFMGRRRGWLLVTQAALIVSISAMAFSSPGQHPGIVAVLALIVAFTSSSQDIVNDAYRIEILRPEEYGLGSSLYVLGYRAAMFVSGAGSLLLADYLTPRLGGYAMAWRVTYLVMASTLFIGIITTFLSPEPAVEGKPPANLSDAVIQPLLEYFKRPGSVEILIFLVIYKLDTNLTIAMTTPFMMKIGFTKTDIGAVVKGFGTFALMGGTMVAGISMIKLGLRRSLWIFGITQAVAGLTYMLLAQAGHNYPLMVAAIATENFFSGMGLAAMSAFMMNIVDKRFTATQYSLITSFMALSRYVASAPSGWLADNVSWPTYFVICTLIGIPGLLMLLRFKRWTMPSDA
ncbi:MAG: AmpG family muropeptide MFS transporter [Deltaproteobacteria bacterium]|nr:AmpG family muropeptide MFS transporter [Deltaproteobacteria bacterium]